MSPAGQRSGPGWIDAATVVIAVMWVGLWLLWPSVRPGRPAVKRVSLPDVRLLPSALSDDAHVNPVLFAAGSRFGFSMPEDARLANGLSDEPLGVAGRFLGPPELALPEVAGSSATVARVVGTFRLSWPEAPVLTAVAPASTGLAVRVSGALVEEDLHVGEALRGLAARFPGAWSVTVELVLGTDGSVEHVFLETGSGNRDIDTAVCRVLSLGWGSAAGGSRRGRVQVDVTR